MFNGMFKEYLSHSGGERYDLIFLSMILEHIVNPYEFICKCAELTNRYIFIEVPTLDYKLEEEPYGMFCEEHVSIFTRESLTSLMAAAGFVPVNEEIFFNEKIDLPAGYPALCTLWEKRKEEVKLFSPMVSSGQLFQFYMEQNEALLNRVRQKIDAIPKDTKIALWGVGHHASMLLANTSLLEKKIVAVYDADERKRGLCFADNSIHPFDISEIKTMGIDKVVITTYTAQKAIKSYIERNGWDFGIFIFLYMPL